MLLATAAHLASCGQNQANGQPANGQTPAQTRPDTKGGKSGKGGGPAREAALVSVASATRQDVPVVIEAIGTAEAKATITVRPQLEGQVMQVHFTEGQEVRKGDRLFTIDPRPLQARLRQAEADLARAQAGRRQAQANLERDRAQARRASDEAARYESLFNQRIISRNEYEQVRTNAESLSASADAGGAAVQNTAEAIRAAQAQIDQAKLELGYTEITAPTDGRTGDLAVDAGNIVKANDTELVTIRQIEPIEVSFAVPERHLPDLQRHMSERTLTARAAPPQEADATETGTLTFLDNTVDRETGTIRLKATFDNAGHRLWPGQFVNVALLLETKRDAVVVPSQAVQMGQQGAYVYVVGADNIAQLRTVDPGQIAGNVTVIERGLEAGERIVIDGQMRVAPNMPVRIRATPQGASLETPQGASLETPGGPSPGANGGLKAGDSNPTQTAHGGASR